MVGVMRGGSGQDPSWLLWQSLAPGWVRGGLTPHTGPLTLKLHTDQASGTALPPIHSHAGTLSYHDVKIKGWREREEEKDFPVFAAGDPGTQVGAVWH